MLFRSFGAGAVRFGLPSLVRGRPAVGYLIHCPNSGSEPVNINAAKSVFMETSPTVRQNQRPGFAALYSCNADGVVRIIFQPSLSRRVIIAPVVAVIPHATLWALHAVRIVWKACSTCGEFCGIPRFRSEEHTSNSSHSQQSRMPSSA